ncbi:hypothetical protein AAFF_G00294040 [Aldrovandia affinis]|uniref:Uncharacterized protein n=1 Tax=Aldrovandia affinis TaxID=143900 RepID=A0AAD7R9L7_9TELE|nr:hypothetical protein AAFF_G00294040 [Aldrovandia affinis]
MSATESRRSVRARSLIVGQRRSDAIRGHEIPAISVRGAREDLGQRRLEGSLRSRGRSTAITNSFPLM